VKLLVRWVILVVAVIFAAWLTGLMGLGFQADTENWPKLFLGAAVLAIFNATIGTILRILTLPLTCLTFGLFGLVVNGLVLIIAASLNLGFTFTTQGTSKFFAAIIASAIISFTSSFLSGVLIDNKEDRQ
jgi:putative membrane protein